MTALELIPGVFVANVSRRQRMLDQVGAPATKKAVIERWLQNREIWGDEAEVLLQRNGLADG